MEELINVKPLVLITGVTGFLGSHVCMEFLKSGNFRVRGSVRDLPSKTELLQTTFGEYYSQIEFVEMNLENESEIKKAVEGCNYVVHIASPTHIKQPKNEKELIDPALQGTLILLKAAQQNKVQRVVLTSSYLAICHNKVNSLNQYDETKNSNLKACEPYSKSKVLTEQAAWDFISRIDKKQRFLLIVLNPGIMIGPTLTGIRFSSGIFLQKIMSKAWIGLGKFSLPIDDVRDSAQAHYLAVTNGKIEESQRILVTSNSYWVKEIAAILNKRFPQYKINTSDIPFLIVKAASYFDDVLKFMMPFWNKEILFDNKRSINILGATYRDIEETLVDGVQSMIDKGLIKKKNEKSKKQAKDEDIDVIEAIEQIDNNVLPVRQDQVEESKHQD